MTHALSGAALVLYLIACALFARKDGQEDGKLSGRVSLAGGILLHLISLVAEIRSSLGFGLGLGISIASLIAASIVFFLVTVKLRGLSSGAVLVVIVLYMLSAVLVHLDEQAKQIPHWGLNLWVHIATTLTGVICFLFGSFFSFVYLLQDRLLKGKKVGNLIGKLPSLRDLSVLSLQFVQAGIWTMTAGILLGFLFANDISLSVSAKDPKLIWSLLMLVYYGVVLTARREGMLTEFRFVKFCSFGAVLVVLALILGSQESFHQY